jgi:hypothetical protein
MPEGISTSRQCQSSATCLAASGKSFVFRYYSRTTRHPQKRLSPREAAELARAGLDIAVVYQDNARLPEDFGAARGRLDGASAQAAAAVIGQPAGSAIYFAVDEDFSSAQIQSFVLPYFRGVKEGMDSAAGGSSGYDIGIYGSGLACQLVRDSFALARYAWVAESTGWRGTDTYTGWDVKQHKPPADLCDLGQDWERCEAPAAFGAFRPLGSDVQAAAGRPMWVVAPQLNLRAAPTVASQPPITQLPEGHPLRVLGDAEAGWLRVRTTLGGSDVIGYVNGRFLSATMPAAAATAALPRGSVPAVHYRENDARSQRASTARRAQPLGETPRPSRVAVAPAAERVRQIGAIVDWLDVEHSARYRRDIVTFCNVYAADFCHLANVYLPRVWWKASALMKIAAGQTPPVVYDGTVREMRADDLYAWLAEFGPAFGWRRVFDPTALQNAANQGLLAVIVADRLEAGRPGHITLVVPETATQKAERDVDGNVILPLQSQAGAANHAYATIGRDWWNDQQFADQDGFFVNED